MKNISRAMIVVLLFSVGFLFVVADDSSGEEQKALKDLKTVKAIFDVRIGNPKSAALLINAVYDTYKSKNIRSVSDKPDFVVVFLGPSVKLISRNKEGFSPEDQTFIDGIAETISEMAKDGIRLEICLFAARIFKVEPESVLPEIKRVENGLISLIGYQAKGYSLVPVY